MLYNDPILYGASVPFRDFPVQNPFLGLTQPNFGFPPYQTMFTPYLQSPMQPFPFIPPFAQQFMPPLPQQFIPPFAQQFVPHFAQQFVPPFAQPFPQLYPTGLPLGNFPRPMGC